MKFLSRESVLFSGGKRFSRLLTVKAWLFTRAKTTESSSTCDAQDANKQIKDILNSVFKIIKLTVFTHQKQLRAL